MAEVPAGMADDDKAAVRREVRDRYAAAAVAVANNAPTGLIEDPADGDGCCDPAGCGATAGQVSFGSGLYSGAERAGLPDGAVAASLGCGNPTAVAELREGETVLDLGSGGGIDVLLSARRVGPTGKAYGLDMTDEMLDLAVANARAAGATNVEFLKGQIEDIPLPAGSVDVIISNCVINLSTDKAAVFAESARVLRPGGRLGVTDVVADDELTPADRAERGDYVGCVAGALSIAEYRAGLEAAGFADIAIEPTHDVADGMHSAIIRAVKRDVDSEGRRLRP
jgi:SAM-dependent methyltransferase